MIRWSRRRRSSSASYSATSTRLRGPVEAARVDPERVGADPGLAAVVEDGAALVVDLEADQLAAAVEEVAAVGGGVEADDVVGEQAAVDLLAPVRRQDPPGVGLRPRDVDEVLEEDVRPALADRRRAGVEVVVLEHHQRLVPALDRPDDRLGDVAVDDLVAALPGVELLAADVGCVREVPEVVLDEPEDRVRDHVVEARRRRRGRTRPGRRRRRPRRARARSAAVGLAGDGDVLVGHRRRDPERPPMVDEPGQRRHQPASSAARHPLAVLAAVELRRPAVGDDYELFAMTPA